MARRTKIPIVILLGILFFFIAVSLYRGCSVIEGNILLKYFQTLADLQKCKNKDKKKAEGGGDAEEPKPRDPKTPACTAPEDYNTNCTGYGEDMIKLYTETFIPSRIQEGLERPGIPPKYGLKSAQTRIGHGEQAISTANLFWRIPASWAWRFADQFYSIGKRTKAEGEQQKWEIEGAIKDIEDVHGNMLAKNTELARARAEERSLTDLSNAAGDALKIGRDGLDKSIKITHDLEENINDMKRQYNEE